MHWGIHKDLLNIENGIVINGCQPQVYHHKNGKDGSWENMCVYFSKNGFVFSFFWELINVCVSFICIFQLLKTLPALQDSMDSLLAFDVSTDTSQPGKEWIDHGVKIVWDSLFYTKCNTCKELT